jgi:hypothetical protein
MEYYSTKHSHVYMAGFFVALLVVLMACMFVGADKIRRDVNVNAKNLTYAQERMSETDARLNTFMLDANQYFERLGTFMLDANQKIELCMTNGVSIESHFQLMQAVNYLLIKEKEQEQEDKKGWFRRK